MIGSVLEGRYTLNGFLAEGPIFTLYSARDRLTTKDVSLRLLKPPFDSEEEFKKALEKAIAATAIIQSPFVERLLHLGGDSGKSFLVGELTRAPSLADRIRKLAPFTPPVGVACAINIARGLEAFHKVNLAHGDVSGDNVAMLGDGEVRLQLGGIWSAYSASATAGVLVLPSLAPYLAPEISNGESPNASSDLYAAGILLYELLTGRRPYQAENGLATAMRHSTEPTPRVRSLNPSIPVVLDEIVAKVMAKDPASRYRNASEFLFDLRQTQDALRFGRNLSWPISPATPTPSAPRTVHVAPRMSAIRGDGDTEKVAKKNKPERDVPVWMISIFGIFAIAAISLVVANFLISATSPRMVFVPNLTGMSVAEARGIAKAMKLTIKEGATVPSGTVEQGMIIDSEPAKGRKIPENSSIVVNESEGPAEVKVPNLKGKTVDKARELLDGLNLKLDDNVDKISDISYPEGTICRQTPKANQTIVRPKKIHVTINEPSDLDAGQSKSYQYDISVKLPALTGQVQLRIEMTDDDGDSDLYDEMTDPGQTVRLNPEGKSDQATFTIYYNDNEVEKDEYYKGKLVHKKETPFQG